MIKIGELIKTIIKNFYNYCFDSSLKRLTAFYNKDGETPSLRQNKKILLELIFVIATLNVYNGREN